MNHSRRQILSMLAAATAGATSSAFAQAPQSKFQEPVFRIAANNSLTPATHPLDEALRIAHEGLQEIRTNISDYTATLVKRELVGNTVGEYEYMFIKVRNRRVEDGRVVVPFSVYLAFLKPATVKGREVIYVEQQNDNKMVAHEGGFKGRFLPTVWLKPEGAFAMRGQKYPLTEIGIENLVLKLIERGEQDRQHKDVKVEFRKNAKINGRDCSVIQVTHPEYRPEFDFSLGQIFIDDQMNIPVRYVAYGWPKTPGQKPEINEEYTYLNVKLNVGLTDADFDPNNPNYSFYSK
ncbi:hypothetical protein CA51_39040 [Rosistilla oblonga]|uniref:DUF1571 domain-containing protein n=1 Tax=Rosistilla oblonga TaxID=2527990 RepID=A0A518IXI4_9BACT|nr:DUF1571 domain-containing protein [Rosistilla oblonga]QDV14012.1 hypothetical protein CA51_39040 [Rosistilla oblonga]QDV57795.1 hypothetical protein Mal33_38100 [Rosistilla oblonga]